jgi:ATP-dependent Lon protease
MKESAQTAYSCVRGFAQELGIDSKKFETYDVHLHVPQGAIPKDGPSAGIGIALSLISAFKEEPLRQDFAMTGEISLNGRVMPIGGVREKLLAALRNRITTVCLPEKNRGSFVDLPITIKRKMNVCFASHILEVVKYAFGESIPIHELDGTKEDTQVDLTLETLDDTLNVA